VLADDNADMREYVARLLSAQWDVEAVPDGVHALAAARRDPPALVVSDVMMPNLDGFGLLRALRADPRTRTTPVMLLSARAGDEATAEGLQSGANDYLVKPFSARELVARVAAQITIADIREEAQRAKEAERKIIETLFNEAPSPITLIRGPELVVEFANPACLAIWQRRSASEVVGKPLLEALPELRGQGFDELLREVVATGKVLHRNELPATLRRPDGEEVTIFFNIVFAPSANPRGEIDGVSVFAFEVTPQVVGRERAELGAQIGRALVSPQALDGQLRHCCEALVRMGARSASLRTYDPSQGTLDLRASCGEAEGDGVVDAHAPADAGELGEVLRTRRATFSERAAPSPASPALCVGRVPLVVGERVIGVLSLTSRAPFGDDFRATLSTTADQIALAIDRDQGERFRELFIGMLGHDLRNPLNAVLMATLLLSSTATDKQKRALARIESSARRMERMVRQVLDFTRARSGGGIPVARAPCDLVPVCEQVIEELRAAHGDRAVQWRARGDARASWDADRMAQMISNLVGNALNYGDRERPVAVTLDGGEEAVTFSVHNHGPPIPPELRAKLFDPFRRATHAKSNATQGLGLGLFITDQIVRAHGGTIAVQSSETDGTRFTVTLPKRGASA
jgi:signal transduction histidine kinase/CheY-like chemotaxis protein